MMPLAGVRPSPSPSPARRGVRLLIRVVDLVTLGLRGKPSDLNRLGSVEAVVASAAVAADRTLLSVGEVPA